MVKIQVKSHDNAANGMHAFASKFAKWKPATDVFGDIQAVKTDFVQFDRATGVNGFPLQRVVLVHGPNNGGKSMFCLGLLRSFINQGMPVLYVDSEYTLDRKYLSLIAGASAIDSPLLVGLRPDDYEQVVDRVKEFAKNCLESFESGDLPRKGFLIVVDSLRKLIPKDLMTKILKESADSGVDGMSGRAGQLRASLNAAWMDQLVPLLAKTGGSIVFVVRESEDTNATAMDRKYGKDFILQGGKAVKYDSSLTIRIEQAGSVKPAGAEDKTVYGETHRGKINKTKLSTKATKTPVFYFHSSNGIASPAGLDTPRDVFQVAVEFGLVARTGAWYAFGDQRWQGEHAAILYLSQNKDMLTELEDQVRANFSKFNPLETDEADEDNTNLLQRLAKK